MDTEHRDDEQRSTVFHSSMDHFLICHGQSNMFKKQVPFLSEPFVVEGSRRESEVLTGLEIRKGEKSWPGNS